MNPSSSTAADGVRVSATSADLDARAHRTLPGGVNSNVRLAAPKIYFERGEGARLYDVDGNEYIDYLLGQGPNILGHAPAKLQADVAAAVSAGMLFGAQHEAEVRAAERVVEILGWPDMVRFGVSGTESVQAALRLARAATGKRRFIRFEGQYHGWLDNTLANWDDEGNALVAGAGQIADYLRDFVPTPWNDLGAVRERLEAHDDIAAIITEPIMLNAGSIPPEDGYLQGLRALADEFGVVLIFDEVITGFRVGLGGAAERYGVTPDLAVYGKAIAAGWPVSALAGRRDLMERFGTGEVNHSGTFNASVMATAAVLSATGILQETSPYERMEGYGRSLQEIIRAAAAKHDLPLHVQGVPMAFHVSFSGGRTLKDNRDILACDAPRYAALSRELIRHGVWVAARGVWYISAAHSDTELADTEERVDRAFAAHAAA
ncbi:aminotransferase class III-fold pyridoxal phosphate-dependent enzyme [Microbacterium lushaniae]|nr:aminotransferase class III-fold pyridoxal phosphate-dependent enzyme [Microbacterium lushaniae]KAA9156832.1 aminotransferase class III-fold pyridoxal phosphate-dependent enzyme [Microbacterium lushaniae]